MESKDFINRLLHLGEGWEISDILVNENFKEIDIFIKYTNPTGVCPKTNTESKIYDFRATRRFRHLDVFEYKTYLNARIPRVINNKSEVNTIELSWAGERVSYTYLFEYRVIDALKMSKNQTKTADFLDTTFDIVHGIMQRAVARGIERRELEVIRALGLDEKSFSGGQKYFTVLSDPIKKCVLDIIEGRKIEDTEELLTWTLSPQQLDKVWFVTMDMWKPYMKAVEEVIPQADILHDKFHTAKYLNKAVDGVRKEEVKKHVILKSTKYMFLKNKKKWTDAQTLKFKEINQINLTTSKAWQIKENFKGIYNQTSKQSCLTYFEEWYKDTLKIGIKQMIKVADTMLKHLKGIINSAVYELTNSVAENLNSQIQVVKSVARGFANVNAYRNAVLFFHGNLKMYPL